MSEIRILKAQDLANDTSLMSPNPKAKLIIYGKDEGQIIPVYGVELVYVDNREQNPPKDIGS